MSDFLPRKRKEVTRRLLVLGLLVLAAYLPILTLPFISDDYTQIPLARHYIASWPLLLHSPELRTRFTYILLDATLDRVFGFVPAPFYTASLVLHFLCSVLVYASGSLPVIGWHTSFWAACFFAVYEGHQEAVMWAAASMELLLFLFGVGAVLLWHLWRRTGAWQWYLLSIVSFALAAMSKESVWIFPVLMALLAVFNRVSMRKAAFSIAPFALAAAAYVLWLMQTSARNLRFTDGSFSWQAHWFLHDLNSCWHLLLIWGLLALGFLPWRRITALSCLWMLLSLLPYSFLTYMPRVPSRHTYLASMGLAWLVASAFQRLRSVAPRASIVVAAVVLLINCEILWVKKLSQFRERAEPTELLRAAALQAVGPIHVERIPVSPLVVQAALQEFQHQAIFDMPGIGTDAHSFSIWYDTAQGERVVVRKQIGTERHGWLCKSSRAWRPLAC